MPVETTWYIDKRVIHQKAYGELTLAEFEESVQQVGLFKAEGTSPVHSIADLIEVEKWPPMLQMSKTARRSPHSDLGWTVIIITDPIVRFIISTLIQMTKGSFKVVNTREEAVKFLLERDSSLGVFTYSPD